NTISSEQVLLQKATEILRQHRVEGLLGFEHECQETIVEKYVGRGRATDRPKRISKKIRYQIKTLHVTKVLLPKPKKLLDGELLLAMRH
ncbi:hypothetical protein H6G97_45805, partial [Nostoc flagelliforme FACHB-838]|nr:hypothetical protein [Nostoc flagelliforme FACHB-838]